MQDTLGETAQQCNQATDRPGEGEGSVVSLDLGHRRLCVSEVLGLRPDMQMEVPFKHGMTLRLRVNGRLAGRGECVALGGNLGVRVIEVYRPRADAASTPAV